MAARAPKHLRAPTAAWFRRVVAGYDLDEHHVRLLTLAGEAFDRASEARELVEAEGIVFSNRFGELRAHPAVAIERDSRIGFARLVRQLDLADEPDSLAGGR